MAALAMAPKKEEARVKWSLGGWSAVIGAIGCTLIAYFLYVTTWEPLLAAEYAAGRPDEAVIVNYILSGLNDLIIFGGVMYVAAAWGFFYKKNWAWSMAVSAGVVAMVGSFFWMIPPSSRGLSPSYVTVFSINFAIYVVMLLWVKPVHKWLVALSIFTGMAYVLSFMNGVASTNKMMVYGLAIYSVAQRLNWAAAVMWAGSTIGLVHRKEWAWILGIGGGILALLGGAPLAYLTTIELGRFSLFTPGPAISLILMVIMMMPKATNWYLDLCNKND